MPRWLWFALTLAAFFLSWGCGSGGCFGYCYSSFNEDLLSTACAKWDECGFFPHDGFTYDDCIAAGEVEDTDGDDWECEDYDKRAAKDCIEAWEHASCEEVMAGNVSERCEDMCSNNE